MGYLQWSAGPFAKFGGARQYLGPVKIEEESVLRKGESLRDPRGGPTNVSFKGRHGNEFQIAKYSNERYH